jgi:hypothetical protein
MGWEFVDDDTGLLICRERGIALCRSSILQVGFGREEGRAGRGGGRESSF